MTIRGLTFRQTCGACPEQYDVFDAQGQQVAYVRLRWGGLSACAPDVSGYEFYYHEFEGDWAKGTFDTAEEREEFLDAIAAALESRPSSRPNLQDEPW